ncbi:hypothetical protein [Streptomyces mirabilis]|uniref:hypothetical protein n=1 Tax=Streptomyces mirabilis TaxID=68239 RepID=UPI0036A0FF50
MERTLRDATGRVAGWILPPIGNANTYRKQLAAGRAEERRLLISDLALGSDKSCRQSLEQARTILPTVAEATRSVVLVSSPEQLDFWRDLLTAHETADGDDDTVVVLRRYDWRGLRDWTQQHSAYETEERLTKLAAITGGWPFLVDKVLDLRDRHRDQDNALEELEKWLARKENAQEFVEAVGLAQDTLTDTDGEDDLVRRGYEAVVEELGSGWNPEGDCVTAAELAGLAEEDARWALTCLETLQALDRDGTRLRVEPVLHAALGTLGSKE